ncbi:MAG TPA: M20/M25/M40 family metallo-hydrolase [Bryobacteraceae bacterium]|jgi:Zn-dependent M28 family amino/carboxypeptidase|nr:M20/M25/M40 family metallo-hydrolase [Bryobacteraceae bacterium]
MRTNFLPFAVVLLAPHLLAQGRPVTPADQAAGQAWWAHIKTLADPGMEGRLTGSEGYLRAAKYVVSQFDAMGLQPAGVNGYYQPVKFDATRVLADESSMTLLVDGRKEPLVLGRDATLGSRGTQPKSITAPLVFIGYGLHLPEAKYDDFDSPELPNSSLKGKIVVYINGGPGDLPGALKSFARTSPLAKALADAGALGTITIPTPKSMDFPWDRVAANASQPGMRLAADPKDTAVAARHPALADIHGTMFSATFNPAEAEKLFAGSGHTFAELLALADAQKPLPRFDLKKSLTASVTTENTVVESPNLVARLEGSDPVLKKEFVLLSAHLDHLGPGAPGKPVFAGAMDDASGVASVLEIAKSFSKNRERPKRSLLFVIFTGEEKGLLGSRYFAGRPTVPEADVVADLNLDMFMPLFPLKKLHVQGLIESTLAEDARAVGAEHNIEIATDPEPDRNSFTRTDQYSFVQAGVPALAMKFGWTANSPEYKAWRQWLAQRYHSSEDNLSQPVDTTAAAQFDSFLGDLARRVANSASRPHYLESSFFHRFENRPPAP